MAPRRRRRLQRTPRRRPRPSALRSGILLLGRQSSQHRRALRASAESKGTKASVRGMRAQPGASPCPRPGHGTARCHCPPHLPKVSPCSGSDQHLPSPGAGRPEFQPASAGSPPRGPGPAAWPLRTGWAPGRGQGGKHHSQQRLPRPVIRASGVRGGRSGARRGSCEKSKHKRGPAGPRAARPGTTRPSGPSAVHGADPAPGVPVGGSRRSASQPAPPAGPGRQRGGCTKFLSLAPRPHLRSHVLSTFEP